MIEKTIDCYKCEYKALPSRDCGSAELYCRAVVEQLQAENKKLKSLLGWWIEYINCDEEIEPPIKETREALQKGGEE